MTAAEFLTTILDPGLAWCAPVPGWTIPADDRARVLLLAIAGQESGWTYRVQGGAVAAAHGFWQFERAGGVAGVLNHAATKVEARAACAEARVVATQAPVWAALATDDNLAVAFARLLLWSDPASLPGLTAEDACWEYYSRLWRPGRPGPDRWPGNYGAAMDAIAAMA